jgi:serine/threonine protein phosphatase PrpC
MRMAERAPIELEWTRMTQIGMRATNQDALGQALHGNAACFILADGAGGHQGGEVAAQIVVEAMLGTFSQTSLVSVQALLAGATCAIDAVARRKQQDPQLSDMSTTVAALLVDCASGKALWAHLGDSRIYLFRDGLLHSMSKDHSLTQQLIDAGYINASQLRTHPQRNLLLAAVGAEGDTPVALCDAPTWLQAGDALLLCTDGLWEWVLEADMEITLAGAPGSAEWIAAMCLLAEQRFAATGKERDNFSAYAIRVREAAP